MPGIPGGGANDCGACRLRDEGARARGQRAAREVDEDDVGEGGTHMVGGAARPMPRPAGAPKPGPGASCCRRGRGERRVQVSA